MGGLCMTLGFHACSVELSVCSLWSQKAIFVLEGLLTLLCRAC